ncbi:protein FAR1-RELATED SEQUENCE 5-like [Gastrolobium bilobum]|uniref:protein FAR1-RELATED SEQUENCE 5-like n=1 Tax=Gastrolobium bilobum TaxID=150636 RepID=UPI002AB26C14|nr:protein FAR1-RELATED SEQUENCE 5-like [Gastrolobium bilobum]
MIEDMDNVALKPCSVYSYFVEVVGGAENVGFLKSDYNNFLQSKRNKTLEAEDAQSFINHFESLQANESSFFYTMQVDYENRMTNFFGMMAYQGQIIITLEMWSFFTQPIEQTKSFVWLIESFLEAINGLQPKTIFIDQCLAIANAIKRVLPKSQHRLCLWHIGQDAAKHLSYYLRKPDFKVLFNRCLYNCGSEQELERKFESVGLLSLHALKVLNFHNIFQIPSQYILKRWTKNAKDGFSISNNGKQVCDNGKQGINYRINKIMKKAIYFATKGALTDETIKMAEDQLEHGKKRLEMMLKNDSDMIDKIAVDCKTSDEEIDEHNTLNSKKS